MARHTSSPTPRIEAWPLLPRRAPEAARPVDEPARAAVSAVVALAALFLALRYLLPGSGLDVEFAKLAALWGGLGSMAITWALLVLLATAPLALPMVQGDHPIKNAALAAFDNTVHLAFVLSVASMLAVIVLHRHVNVAAMMFAGQAALLMVCYRTRNWLAQREEA